MMPKTPHWPRPTICTSTGVEFHLQDPDPGAVRLADVVAGLSRCARYAGQTPGRFYSVAEHSYWVSRLVPEKLRLAALLHDAAEAYMGDCSSPLKNLVGPLWRPIEDRITRAVFQRFGVRAHSREDPIAPEIHHADRLMYRAEKHAMFSDVGWWECDPPTGTLDGWRPEFWGWRGGAARFNAELAACLSLDVLAGAHLEGCT